MTSYGSGARRVEVSSADRVMFPDAGITKGEVVEHYASVADLMLPHIKDRAITMFRSPEGLDGDPFYQQEVPDHFPDWLPRKELKRTGGGSVTHPLADSMPAIAYMANQGCITFHTWLSRVDEPEKPDTLIFDLDPSDDDFEKVREGSFLLRDVISDLGLTAFAKTTGSRGVHVQVPVRREQDFDTARKFCTKLVRYVAEQAPEILTTEQRKSKRGDRVYLDVLRNSYGQTAVAPYSLRLKPGAPVSTPVTWEQLKDRELGPQTYTLKNIDRRLAQVEDPWKDMRRHASSLATATRKLNRMVGDDDTRS